MSSSTTVLALTKNVDGDNARTALSTDAPANMDIIDALFHSTTGHKHTGAGTNGPLLDKDSLSNRTRHLFLQNWDFVIRGGTPAIVVTGSAYPAWGFDTSSDEDIVASFLVPEDWASGSLTVKLWWTNITADAGNVYWAVYCRAVANDEDLTSGGTAAQAGVAITAPAQNVLTVSNIGISFTPAAGDIVQIIVQRAAGTQATDTKAGDAGLVAVEIEYTADM